MAEKLIRPYNAWDNIYAANRAWNDAANRRARLKGMRAAKRYDAQRFINLADEDFDLFSSLIELQDIPSTDPFLVNAAERQRLQKLRSIIPSPYTDEVTNRGLDMPVRMAFNFFALRQPGPNGLPLPPATGRKAKDRVRMITNLEYDHIANFREVMLLGQRRIQRITGIGPVSVGHAVECIHAIDSRLAVPFNTSHQLAALLYDGVENVPARVLTDDVPQITRDLTVGNVLGMPLSKLTSIFGMQSGSVQKAAVNFESAFNECEERRIQLELESRAFIESLAPQPPEQLPPEQ